MELSNAIAAATSLQLPATLVYDYPSVASMAEYVHSMLEPVVVVDADSHSLAPAGPASVGADPAPSGTQLLCMDVAARLPGGYPGVRFAGDADGIVATPYDRWDLEALQASALPLLLRRLTSTCRLQRIRT